MTDKPEAGIGYLTADFFRRFENAANIAARLTAWLYLAGHIRTGDPDERRPASSDPAIPLPATWLAAEEIRNLGRELSGWANLEDIANDLHGQYLAEQLTRQVETALHRWPVSEKPHQVEHVRCTTCYLIALRYLPPRHAGDPVVVKCGDCGATEDADHFNDRITIMRTEMQAARKHAS